MLYINEITWDLLVALGCVLIVGVSFVIGLIKYRVVKHNKTVGLHHNLIKAKINRDICANSYDIGLHIYADKEKNKWALVKDNPKSCDIYSFDSLEDYVLTVNGEQVVRSNMKNIVVEFTLKRVDNITLDIFCKGIKYRYVFLNKECRAIDNSFIIRYKCANEFCDILEYIIGNQK